MLLHCVFIRFKDAVKADQREALLGDVVALKDKIPGIVSVSTGTNVSPEGLGRGFEHGFVVTFENEAARDLYLPHPNHKDVGSRLVEAADGGLSGIMVFDLLQ